MMSRPGSVALTGLVLLTLAAFAAAYMAQGMGWLSFVPPATDAVPDPQPDTDASTALALYQSAFTAWAALILLLPAYWFYLTRGADRHWLALWAASYVAYLLHLYVSAFLFFGGDFAWMTSSSRVSAFWPGMALIVWWGIDIVLALRGADAEWIGFQRAILHLGTFVLFFGGSAIKGETATIKIIGFAFAGVAMAGIIMAKRRRTT